MNLEWSEIENILNGTASAEERVRLDRWLSENPDKKEYFEKIHHYFVDTESAVEENISQRKSRHSANTILQRSHSGRLIRRIVLTGGVAAAVLFFSMILYYREAETVAIEPIIMAEQHVVKLIKDSGEEINLEEIGTASIKVDTAKKTLHYIAKSKEEVIEYHTIAVPKETDYSVTLSDGTKIKLNAGSQLRYPTRFKEGEPRKVYLSGEGYFEVVHSDKNQFVVNVEQMNVVVYGTKFNINSYSNNIETVLEEGSVAITVNGKTQMMKPNEKSIVSKLGDNVRIEQVNARDYLSWTGGYFVFENKPLREIIETIQRWYDCEIQFDNEEVQQIVLSCHVEKTASLDDFLNAIMKTDKVKYRRVYDKYLIW